MIGLLKWIGAGVGILVGAADLLIVVVIGGARIAYDLRAPARTAGGDLQATAQYVTMSDGVRIAVDVFLPPHMEAGAKVPSLRERCFGDHLV